MEIHNILMKFVNSVGVKIEQDRGTILLTKKYLIGAYPVADWVCVDVFPSYASFEQLKFGEPQAEYAYREGKFHRL